MDTMEALMTRRSIRKYEQKTVSEDLIEKILRAAMAAPSANNEQPWHFIVVEDRNVLDLIPRVHPYAQMVKEATLAILVCGDTTLEKHPGYWVVDCCAATENLLLACHALGLGAVWLGVYPRAERMQSMNDLFGLPAHIKPCALISIGYPAEKKDRPDRYKTERVHRNHW